MSEQRDQWGETAEERHARILGRDLAWMTYAEACARDGVPRSERDHLIFNDGYAAGRADYLPAAGVVAEEPEWEWGFRRDDTGTVHWHPTREGAERSFGLSSVMNYPSGRLMQRRPAGPWVPVKQEGAPEGG